MRSLLIALLLVGAAWFTFSGVGQNHFVLLDDDLHITNNPLLNTPSTDFAGIWRAPYQGLYIPVTYSVWAVEKALLERYWGIWGNGPMPKEAGAALFHYTNWALHVANTFLVFLILFYLIPVEWTAFAGALLFCLHPVQVEPIAWISGLKDLLSGFFALLAIYLYLRFSATTAAGDSRSRRYYVLASLFFLLGLLSKPSVVVVPLMIVALEKGFRGIGIRTSLQRMAPWIACTIPLAWLTKYAQPSVHMTYVTSLVSRPFIASDALTFYISKLTVPLGLAPDYGRNPLTFLHSGWRWITWIVPLLMGIILKSRTRATQAAFAVFLLALAPVLGFVTFYFQEFSTVADRYLYLAMLGPALLLAYLAAGRPGWRTVGVVTLLLGALCARAKDQSQHWKDSISLFVHNILVNPDSILSHNNLGTLLEAKEEWLQAAYHYNEVIRIDPENLAGHYNYGRLLGRLGRFDLSLKEFERVVRRQPAIPDAQYSMGLIHLRNGDPERAKGHLFLALKYRPDHAGTLAQLGITFRETGDCRSATRYFDAALQRDPDHSEAHFGKGKCLLKEGKRKLAAAHFASSAKKEPGWDAPRKALAELKLPPSEMDSLAAKL